MNLNKIALFVRTMDAGSFTKAAKFLKQPKSRVARNIASLEKELGVSLIYRTTRQFSPTEAGHSLYERCKDLVYALEGATSDLTKRSGEASGRLRVTAADDLGSMLLGPVIAEMNRLYPKVDVALHLSNDYVDLVKEGIDLAIRIGALEDTALKTRLIGRVTMILVASPEYLKAAPSIEGPRDLVKHPALYFAAGEEDHQWHLQSRSGRTEVVPVQPHCWANNPKVLLDLALAHIGIAFIPEFLCVDALKARHLKRVLENYSSQPTPIQFVWPAHREVSPKVKAFIDLGIKHLARYFAYPKSSKPSQ
jgi:LysR family transcriptional regulator for bpeEF and oprC